MNAVAETLQETPVAHTTNGRNQRKRTNTTDTFTKSTTLYHYEKRPSQFFLWTVPPHGAGRAKICFETRERQPMEAIGPEKKCPTG